MSLWLFLRRSVARKRQCILRIEQAMQGHLFQESPTPHEGAEPGGAARTADHSAQGGEVKTACRPSFLSSQLPVSWYPAQQQVCPLKAVSR